MDMEEIKALMAIIIAPEETNEIKAFMAKIIKAEETFKEIALAMAMAMLEEPTSTRMPTEEEVENPTILHFLYLLTEINSLLLT